MTSLPTPDPEIHLAVRAAYPRVVATLVRLLGSIDAGEDAAQEAVTRALVRWREDGLPANPAAWLIRAGRNVHTDLLRRTQVVRQHEVAVGFIENERLQPRSTDHDAGVLEDDLLRLVFTCCHPLLSPAAQMALTLKVIFGFSVQQVAQALLVRPATIEKRITRAKRRLAEQVGEYCPPGADQLEERLAAVLRITYLVFNEGNDRPLRPSPVSTIPQLGEYSDKEARIDSGEDLSSVGIRLARMLVRLFRYDAESRSLLALCLLTQARRGARYDTRGLFVPLDQQDRRRWNPTLVAEGRALIDAVYTNRTLPGSYQLQGAIAALHCVPHSNKVDWMQIYGLYQRLLVLEPSPVVRLNTAVAAAYCGLQAEALKELAELNEDPRLVGYQPLHVARAFVFERVGANREALNAYTAAIECTTDDGRRRYLVEQRRLLDDR